MLFLAHMLNRPVLDADNARLGWVEDLILTGMDLFPRVEAIVLARRGRGAVFIPWEAVAEITDNAVRLSTKREDVPQIPLDNDALFLRRDILDKQVVDINGRKVVRVNDLQFVYIDGQLRLVGADIGLTGLLRRLSLEQPARALARAVKGQVAERVIPWNYVEGIETDWLSLRLNVSQRKLYDLPPTDIADILSQLHPDDRDEMVQLFDDETLADMLPHMEEEMQADVIMALSDERASDIIEYMAPDEAADVLGDLPTEHAERILHLMEPDEAEDVRELLQYGDETAGGRMTTEFLAFVSSMSVAEVLAALRAQAPGEETSYYLYVVDENERLNGVLSVRDLITAEPDVLISELAREDVLRVHVDDDQESVARLLTRYHLLAIPVVDDDGVLCGIITADDVLEVMQEEAQEDLSRVTGAVEESDVLASPWQLATLRLPWQLGAALAGMMAALYIINLHGEGIERNGMLFVALLPLLLLLGAQIGVQGAVIAQVALGEDASAGEIIGELWRLQWPRGMTLSLLAAVIGAVFSSLLGAVTHPLSVGGVIFFSLIVTMLFGGLLPIALYRLRWDPALVSRPALAVIAMLIGIPLLAQVL